MIDLRHALRSHIQAKICAGERVGLGRQFFKDHLNAFHQQILLIAVVQIKSDPVHVGAVSNILDGDLGIILFLDQGDQGFPEQLAGTQDAAIDLGIGFGHNLHL